MYSFKIVNEFKKVMTSERHRNTIESTNDISERETFSRESSEKLTWLNLMKLRQRIKKIYTKNNALMKPTA